MLLTPFRDSIGILGAEPHPELERWTRNGRAIAAAPADLVSAAGRRPVCSLVSRLDSNYFHWLIDACGQLEALDIYRWQTGSEPIIVVRSGAPAFVKESLGILGVDANRIVEWPIRWSHGMPPERGDPLAVPTPRLVVSPSRHYGHGCSARSLAWLRASFLRGVLGDDTQRHSSRGSGMTTLRLYIQRPIGGWRQIANERAVRACVEELGFQVVRPGEHSLSEQISLFSRASMIVGMHGAGLTNILFAPHAELVELAGGYGGSDYFSMCNGLGNRYTRIQCVDLGEDIEVDLAVLRRGVSAATR